MRVLVDVKSAVVEVPDGQVSHRARHDGSGVSTQQQVLESCRQEVLANAQHGIALDKMFL